MGEFESFKKHCTDYTGPTAFGRENPGIAFQLRLECLIQTWPRTWCSHCIALAFWDPHRGIYSQIGLSDGWIGPSYLLPGNDHNSKSQSKTTSTQPTCLSAYLESRSRIEGEWDVEMQTCGCTHGQSSVSSRDGLWSNRSCLGYKAIPQAVLNQNWTLDPTWVDLCI